MPDVQSPSEPPVAADAVRRARLTKHGSILRRALLGSAVLGVLLMAAQARLIPAPSLALWGAVLLVALAFRASVGFSYLAVEKGLAEAQLPAWSRRFHTAFALHGAAWGLAAWLLFPPADIAHQIFLTFALTTAAVGSLAIAAFDLTGALLFVAACLAPLFIRLFLTGGEVHALLGLLVMLFLGYVRVSALRAQSDAEENAILKAAEEARSRDLQRSEALLEQTGEMVGVGGFELDAETLNLRWTSQMYRIHEIEPGTSLSLESGLQRYGPEARPVIESAIRDALEQGRSFEVELPLITAKGRSIWVRVLGRPQFEGDRVARVTGALEEITERRSREDYAREHHEQILRFQAVLLAARDYQGDDLAAFYRMITENAAAALGVDRASVWLFDDTGLDLVCQELFSASRGEHQRGLRLARSEYPIYIQALMERDSLLAHDVYDHPATVELVREYAPRVGMTSLLTAPLRRGDELIGELSFGHVGPKRRWTPEEERFATSLAAAVLLVWENAQRRQAEASLRREKDFLEALHRTTLDVLARNDLDEILQAIVERAALLLDAPFAEATLKVGESLQVRASTPNHPVDRGAFISREEAPLSWQVCESQSPVVVNDYSEGPRSTPYASMSLHAVAEFPILLEGRCLGVLSFGRAEAGRPFGPAEIERGRMLAQHAALVVHNAGIYADAILKAEEGTVALRDSEERFRRIFENSPITIAVASIPEGRFLAVNEAGTRLFGFDPSEVLGRTTEELRLWDDLEERRRYLAILESRGKVDGFEATLRKKNGEAINVLFSTAVLKSEGQGRTSLVTMLDITERRRAEQAMRQFRAALDQSSDAIYLIDPRSGRFTDLNQTAHDRLGYSREEHLTLSLADIEGNPEETVRWPEHLESLRRAGHLTLRSTHRRKSGETFPVEMSIRYIEAAPRDYLVAIARDVSERVRAEEAIRESEERFHAVFVHSPVSFALTSVPEERIVEMNAASLAAFGYTREEAIGRTAKELGLWASAGERERLLTRLRALGTVSGDEVLMRRRDGSTFPALYSGTLIQIGGEAFNLSTVQDITLRKQAEESLSRLNLDLEAKVFERTAELEHARRLAEQASEAKSQFLANMSHEIRTPLNGVLGMLDVLRQTTLKSHQEQMADLAHESANSLLSIVEDVLDFSKIEAGMIELERAPFSITGVVEKVCELHDQVATKKGVDLTLFTDPRLPGQVLGDAMRLRQILHNIVGNAIKFSSAQALPRRVSVRAVRCETGDGRVGVEFEVTDNGIGIAKDALARLFNSFTQADASITKRFGGTGLGLSISRTLTRLMGGDIEVRSQVHEGSTFTIRLPFHPAGTNSPSPTPLLDATGISCLVVGPTPGLSEDLSVYLEAAGAKVNRAADLQTASRIASEGPEGAWVWVLDASEKPISEGDAQAAGAGLNGRDSVFVILGRGRRRSPRKTRPDVVQVDGNVLSRGTFLHAVAMALGRLPEERSPTYVPTSKTSFAPAHDLAVKKPHRILVAEDNRVNQMVVLQQLKALGYSADVAPDGREALRKWESGDYAMVVTDLQMPEMDGYELSAAIRDLEKTKGRDPLPIVALTANALKDEAERCQAAGMNDYVAKPAGLAEIRAVLEKWLPSTPVVEAQGDSEAQP